MKTLSVNLNVAPAFLSIIREHGITEISSEFNGSGDDGWFENMEVKATHPIVLIEECQNEVESFFCCILEQLNPGWEIDDGSYGDICIRLDDTSQGEILLSITKRVPLGSFFQLKCQVMSQ